MLAIRKSVLGGLTIEVNLGGGSGVVAVAVVVALEFGQLAVEGVVKSGLPVESVEDAGESLGLGFGGALAIAPEPPPVFEPIGASCWGCVIVVGEGLQHDSLGSRCAGKSSVFG